MVSVRRQSRRANRQFSLETDKRNKEDKGAAPIRGCPFAVLKNCYKRFLQIKETAGFCLQLCLASDRQDRVAGAMAEIVTVHHRDLVIFPESF